MLACRTLSLAVFWCGTMQPSEQGWLDGSKPEDRIGEQSGTFSLKASDGADLERRRTVISHGYYPPLPGLKPGRARMRIAMAGKDLAPGLL